MLLIISWITVILSTIPFYKSVKYILIAQYSILHFSVVAFYIMQVLPLLIENIFGINQEIGIYTNMYLAMTDDDVGLIYCAIILIIIILLYGFANQLYRKKISTYTLKNIILQLDISVHIKLIIYICMFLPVFAVVFSPNPSIYLQFAYFYKNEVGFYNAIRAYHTNIILITNYIAFGSTMLQYLYKKKTSLLANLDIIISVILYSWIDQKRALLIFSLLGILAIDILKQTYQNKERKLVKRTFLFGTIVVVFFWLYSEYTSKGSGTPFLVQYTTYYSRMSSVKTAIYDLLNRREILEYNGQSLLYNLLFFIPRSSWPTKPVMYCKYFTRFVMNTGFLPWNLQVNIWAEFISNFGFWGVLIALLIILKIAKITENSRSMSVYIFGTIFLVFYFCFGFETLTVLAYAIWMVGLIVTKAVGMLVATKSNKSAKGRFYNKKRIHHLPVNSMQLGNKGVE